MTSAERVRRALAHEAGPVPVDFGATPTTGIHVSVVEGLRRHYGLDDRPVKVVEPYQMLGEVEADLREAMGIDVVGVSSPRTLFGFALEDWKDWRTPWGQEVRVPGAFNVTEDGKDLLIYPEGDTSVPASGRMPDGGYFFDSIVRQPPLDEDALDPQDNLEEFGPVSDEALAWFDRETQRAAAWGCAVIANFGGTAFGDIALVPAPFLKHPKGIRDVAEWYMSTVTRQDYIHAIFRRQCELALGNLARLHAVVGDRVDAVFVCGTDFGTQDGQFCSVETFRSLWLPYYKAVNDWIHGHTTWKTFKHSCGSVVPLLDAFVEAGFDILNPVQCSAAGMDPQSLKDRWGDRLVFWGGGVDTQKTLPFGTVEDVRRQVLQRCEILGAKGGFVFNTIHNVQAQTPVENVVAMIETIKEFNG